jgi:transcription elongation factor Elf1
MIYLTEFIPSFCPSCGSPTKLNFPNNPDLKSFKEYQTMTCGSCGVMFQRVHKKDLLMAATASGGDMLDFFLDER